MCHHGLLQINLHVLPYGATIKLEQFQEKYGDQVQFPFRTRLVGI